jgi:hypothetical protein
MLAIHTELLTAQEGHVAGRGDLHGLEGLRLVLLHLFHARRQPCPAAAAAPPPRQPALLESNPCLPHSAPAQPNLAVRPSPLPSPPAPLPSLSLLNTLALSSLCLPPPSLSLSSISLPPPLPPSTHTLPPHSPSLPSEAAPIAQGVLQLELHGLLLSVDKGRLVIQLLLQRVDEVTQAPQLCGALLVLGRRNLRV